jgi:hypothetical protein
LLGELAAEAIRASTARLATALKLEPCAVLAMVNESIACPRPAEPHYDYTLAFYLRQSGNTEEAVSILNAIIEKHPAYLDPRPLLQEMSKTKDTKR